MQRWPKTTRRHTPANSPPRGSDVRYGERKREVCVGRTSADAMHVVGRTAGTKTPHGRQSQGRSATVSARTLFPPSGMRLGKTRQDRLDAGREKIWKNSSNGASTMCRALPCSASRDGACRSWGCVTKVKDASAPSAEPNTAASCPTAMSCRAPTRSARAASHSNATACSGFGSRAKRTSRSGVRVCSTSRPKRASGGG